MEKAGKFLEMLKDDEKINKFYNALNQQMLKKSKLGDLLQENINEVRDDVLYSIQKIIDGTWDNEESQILFKKTQNWSSENKKILEDYVKETIDTTILQLFQSLDDESDLDVVYKKNKKETVSLKEACNETYGSIVDAVAELMDEDE